MGEELVFCIWLARYLSFSPRRSQLQTSFSSNILRSGSFLYSSRFQCWGIKYCIFNYLCYQTSSGIFHLITSYPFDAIIRSHLSSKHNLFRHSYLFNFFAAYFQINRNLGNVFHSNHFNFFIYVFRLIFDQLGVLNFSFLCLL